MSFVVGAGAEVIVGRRPFPLDLRGRRQTGLKGKRRCRPWRRAAVRHAMPIFGPPAMVTLLRTCLPAARVSQIAGHHGIQNLVAYSSVIPGKSPAAYAMRSRAELLRRARRASSRGPSGTRERAPHARRWRRPRRCRRPGDAMVTSARHEQRQRRHEEQRRPINIKAGSRPAVCRRVSCSSGLDTSPDNKPRARSASIS
jgi:hypothetical protein